jgi:O-antigen ligase
MLIALICASSLLKRKRRLISGLVCTLAIVVLVLFIDGALGFPLTAKFGRMETVQWRITQSLAAWEMFLKAPVFGHGPHTYGLSHRVPWVHNLYAEVLAERGILGFSVLGFILIYVFSLALKIPSTASSDAHIFGAGALAGLIGFCSAAVVELSFLREWVVITLFLLLGVIGHLSASRPQEGRKAHEP